MKIPSQGYHATAAEISHAQVGCSCRFGPPTSSAKFHLQNREATSRILFLLLYATDSLHDRPKGEEGRWQESFLPTQSHGLGEGRARKPLARTDIGRRCWVRSPGAPGQEAVLREPRPPQVPSVTLPAPRRLAPPGSPAPSAVAAPASASPPSLLMCQLLGGVLGGTLG